MPTPAFSFATIGINHGHIYEQTALMLAAGCRLKYFCAPEDDLAAEYVAKFPQAERVTDERKVPLALRAFVDATGESRFGQLFAMSTLSLIPVFFVFLAFQRLIIRGVALGALKR